ncbi:hypothetical protein ABTZ78_27735 [Streptomyces bauhiniae]|uniref:hypothetical protein n=1 Tax=Streptomyces bauhiniae TaxID=2340725 RepID=UPI00332EF131
MAGRGARALPTVLWFGESPSDVSPSSHALGVEFINSFLDKHQAASVESGDE